MTKRELTVDLQTKVHEVNERIAMIGNSTSKGQILYILQEVEKLAGILTTAMYHWEISPNEKVW